MAKYKQLNRGANTGTAHRLLDLLDDDNSIMNTMSLTTDQLSTQGFYVASASGALVANAAYATTEFIEVNELEWIHFYKCAASGAFGINSYDVDKVLIKNGIATSYESSTATDIFSIKTIANTKYIRISYAVANAATFRVCFGVFPVRDIPKKTPKIVLPTYLYQVRNKIQFYYKANAVLADRALVTDVDFSTLAIGYPEMASINRTTASTVDMICVNYAQGNQQKQYKHKLQTIDAATNSGKTINKLHIGNSFADFGFYITEINALLAAAGVTVNEIGTKGVTGNFSENYSGGNMANYMNISGRPARILTVSGVTLDPQTAFPGAVYNDANGQPWTCTGYKLSGGAGKIKFTRNADTVGTEIPASGTFTKVSGTGDATITYTAYDTAFNNPFWNPATGLRDIAYYITYWGFNAPDIVEISLSVNDLPNYRNPSEITAIKDTTKILIDEILTAYPSCKVIYTIQPVGAHPSISYGSREGVHYSTLQYVQMLDRLITADATYTDKLFLCPAYAQVNPKLGYTTGAYTPNSRYPSDTITYAFDSIHLNEGGWDEYADSIYNVIQKTLTLL